MKLSPFFLVLALIILLFSMGSMGAPQAQANTTIVMGSVRGYTESNLLLTDNTGAYVGIYNTTSTLELEDAHTYYMMLQPNRQDLLNDPLTFFDWLYAEIPTIFCVMVIGVLVGWILFAPMRVGRGR